MKIIFTCDITEWAAPEDFASMSVAEVEELVREDLTAALEFASVEIVDDLDVTRARAAALYAKRAKETP